MSFFDQEQINGKLTKVLHLNNSKLLQKEARFKFAGMHITEFDNIYNVDQDFYMNEMEKIISIPTFSNFVPW